MSILFLMHSSIKEVNKMSIQKFKKMFFFINFYAVKMCLCKMLIFMSYLRVNKKKSVILFWKETERDKI